MVNLDVQGAKRQVMRYMQGLRFARSEQELKYKAANLKVNDADEVHGKSVLLG